ncbi:hypothetical protein [Longimicrobium sp.]|uniref:hypothetical protein n=1 Tax=Longimicrobium sp. TaxID=2029185 RepID=UPI002CA56995|nr:hypothetical protein [Longimicrobium sp.]HSU15601.1 hypothetical protein [Longimicrobium sp.]
MRLRVLAFAFFLLPCAVPAPAQHRGPRVGGLLFAGLDFAARQKGDTGFELAQAAGLLNVGFTDHFDAVTEVTATPVDGRERIRVERLFARYAFNDALKLSAGRFHTPIAYWNTAYHHGAWLQTSVARPELIRFGTPLLPLHFAGIQAEGLLPPAPLGLGYVVAAGRGRGSDPETPGRTGELAGWDGRPAWVARVYSRPPALGRVQVGASGYLDRAVARTGTRVDERILSAHLAWEMDWPEVLAEYAHLQHRPAGSGGGWAGGEAWYVQVGGRLYGRSEGIKGYGRMERVRVSAADSLLGPLHPRYDGAVLGLRVDVTPFAMVRGELRQEQRAVTGRANSVLLEASVVLARSSDRPSLHSH